MLHLQPHPPAALENMRPLPPYRLLHLYLSIIKIPHRVPLRRSRETATLHPTNQYDPYSNLLRPESKELMVEDKGETIGSWTEQ